MVNTIACWTERCHRASSQMSMKLVSPTNSPSDTSSCLSVMASWKFHPSIPYTNTPIATIDGATRSSPGSQVRTRLTNHSLLNRHGRRGAAPAVPVVLLGVGRGGVRQALLQRGHVLRAEEEAHLGVDLGEPRLVDRDAVLDGAGELVAGPVLQRVGQVVGVERLVGVLAGGDGALLRAERVLALLAGGDLQPGDGAVTV